MTQDDPRKKLWGKFRDSSTAHILDMSKKLIELENHPSNIDLIKEIFRHSHSLKGDSRMLGFVEISKIAHEMENVFLELREGRMEMRSDLTEVFIEALDYLETLVKDATSGAKPSVNIEEILPKLQALAQPEAAITQSLVPTAQSQAVIPTVPPIMVNIPTSLAATPTVVRIGDDGQPYASIAVDVGKLDVLMNITSELVLTKMEANATLDYLRQVLDLLRQRQRVNAPVRALINNDRDPTEVTTLFEMREILAGINRIDERVEGLLKATFKEYEEHASHLQNTVDELQNNVLTIRMLPIDTLFSELETNILTTAFKLKRAVSEVPKIGGEIEVDKKVLDGLREPLGHITRNAVDHGIELPEKRLALGKARAGKITLEAEQEGSYAYIRVTDDGAGINGEKLKAKAVAKGIWSEARAKSATDEDSQQLLYEYGISSVDIITDISGFGVGMDAAKKAIERLGGSITHTTALGKGTTFTIKMPLTIATARALLVRVNEQIYAVPASNIEAMLYLTPNEVITRNGREVVIYNNTTLPLVKLEDVLGTERRDHPIFQYNSMLGMGRTTAVTTGGKRADNQAYTNSNVSANGNGNGKTTSLLDAFSGLTLAEPDAYRAIQDIHLENPDRTVRTATYERLPGVIVGSGERRFCFIVDELVDEVEIVVKGLSRMLQARHVKNATILGNGRVVVILDVPDLITSAREAIGRSTSFRSTRNKQAKRKRILVVDDSITTRELEKSILEAQGYEVDTADDGTVALDILKRNNVYNLVISDIEMPHMNGFELTANIKANQSLRSLPVIIVSSLNSEENKRLGIAAGAQAYITKGDFSQSNLLDTIEYLTS